MATRAMAGYGGTLTFKIGSGTANGIPVRGITMSRQAAEFDMTALSDTKIYSGPGRVKRSGSCDAYFGTLSANFTTSIEAIDLTAPAELVITDSAGGSTTMKVIITAADLKYDGADAVIYSISFSETISITP
jgi:hypothetical protein